jgi:hypothetical protein
MFSDVEKFNVMLSFQIFLYFGLDICFHWSGLTPLLTSSGIVFSFYYLWPFLIGLDLYEVLLLTLDLLLDYF